MSIIHVAASIALVCLAACADDAPAGVDAACSCPAAEPPLAGRIVTVRDQRDIPGNQIGIAGPACPTGATVLGGGCRLMDSNRGIYVREDGPADGGPAWLCVWDSSTPAPAVGIAEVICLVPAP